MFGFLGTMLNGPISKRPWTVFLFPSYTSTHGVPVYLEPRCSFAAILEGKSGWGGRIRTFTVLINSEVSYQLDHAPAGLAGPGVGRSRASGDWIGSAATSAAEGSSKIARRRAVRARVRKTYRQQNSRFYSTAAVCYRCGRLVRQRTCESFLTFAKISRFVASK
jgi:hypothetical protein